MELSELRLELEGVNKELLSLIRKRRRLAGEIQKFKRKEGRQTYDPARERELFTALKDELSELSLGELGAFSLLMEDQAGEGYPKWSQGEHRGSAKGLGINPLLLLLFYPDKINVDSLPYELKKEFKNLL